MKRILFEFLSLLLISCVLVGCDGIINPDVDEPETLQESPAEDFEYEISKEGDRIIITKYKGTSEKVVIPSQIEGLPVRTIKGYESGVDGMEIIGAFQDSNIKSVVIPDSVRFIYKAFSNCNNLEEVVFGNKSELLSVSQAFENCVSLEKIDFLNTKLEEIDTCCFNGCTSLREIKFSDSLKFIGEKSFYKCESLEEVVLPPNLSEIGKEAFGFCTSLKSLTVPANLDLYAIDIQRFHNVPSLDRIVFVEGREEIVGYAFFDLNSNVEIIIPASVTCFSPYTFFF